MREEILRTEERKNLLNEYHKKLVEALKEEYEKKGIDALEHHFAMIDEILERRQNG